jgi:hypothetical protein
MSNTIHSLNNNLYSIPKKYKNNNYGFSDFNNDSQYIFSLIINGKKINNMTFKNIEDTKYSHLIKLDNQIKLNDIEYYKVSVKILSNNITLDFELEGNIIHNQSNSTECNNNLYIEFSQNETGYAICSCFYTGLDYNKLFVSPPN